MPEISTNNLDLLQSVIEGLTYDMLLWGDLDQAREMTRDRIDDLRELLKTVE